MYRYFTSLSELEYIKLPQGPVPKGYDKLLKDMEEKGIIHIFNIIIYGKKQICFHSLKEPDIKNFKPQEINILDKVIVDLYNQKSSTLSNKTHDDLWHKVQMGDIMPVESVFWQDITTPSEEDIKQALQDLSAKGLCANTIPDDLFRLYVFDEDTKLKIIQAYNASCHIIPQLNSLCLNAKLGVSEARPLCFPTHIVLHHCYR